MDKIPYTFIVPTLYGQMLINRNDINQTEALSKAGRSPDHEEIALLSEIIRTIPGDKIFMDVGANFGAYALELSKHVGANGKVYAFEAQRIIFNMLCGSVALNAIENIHCYNVAVSDAISSIEIPQFDYSKPLNFGSVEFGPIQREQLSQDRGANVERTELVSTVTLDAFAGIGRIDMIKIDVEGMEPNVLEGARAIIARDQPILFIEFFKTDTERLGAFLAEHGYAVSQMGVNYLCIPERLSSVEGPWLKAA